MGLRLSAVKKSFMKPDFGRNSTDNSKPSLFALALIPAFLRENHRHHRSALPLIEKVERLKGICCE